MSQVELSSEEAFHNTFHYFIEGLEVLAMESADQQRHVGGSHAAWELRQDVLDTGDAVLRDEGHLLQSVERLEVAELLEKLRDLPADALASTEDALRHGDWAVLRDKAARLLNHLARPIAKNRSFLKI